MRRGTSAVPAFAIAALLLSGCGGSAGSATTQQDGARAKPSASPAVAMSRTEATSDLRYASAKTTGRKQFIKPSRVSACPIISQMVFTEKPPTPEDVRAVVDRLVERGWTADDSYTDGDLDAFLTKEGWEGSVGGSAIAEEHKPMAESYEGALLLGTSKRPCDSEPSPAP
ncbi:hypothetical protein ACFVWX_08275 [Streptomyces sp. NPDC058220]|uniref:hypothetical protein n=1 Tax=unclassified Streptomyces TaxID=2593676 RepID=UPI00365716DE